ncbi:tRNA(His) guanylyltransferase [Marchantia polymorpha subsp. ruderalis]|uniref:tRNA(His) guanylyltransferase n=2 Tax=Marchantia polymorpha TaxID=3197 RepID=A0AAF6BNS8_MARPO|nr:hypothetical protein MARPO_0167s0023 [Marchantia polymorpha]BBN13662.1 hypothetical protein Mp_6g05410 [Marchantia polymorpha subsp. ruderalis]|eukprot:PTQ28331.1 hypothetical protein MARPO_0167s0023 [Marchantia polymorpha]
MANSKYEYVKSFEQSDALLPHTWIVIRVDGRGFTRFAQVHGFQKPNDEQALHLMNECATAVLEDIPDICFGYGVSDEYSFVLRKNSTLFQRRASKLVSIVVSLFSATYVMKWGRYFPGTEMQYAPSFDGRAVCYPSDTILRDYLSWRQVDCHVNNQYNTCYWSLVHSGCSPAEAQNVIKGTLADFKNELLHTRFGINYNDLPAIFRKGSLVFKRKDENIVKVENGVPIKRQKTMVVVSHEDLIKDSFWKENPSILGSANSKKANLRSAALTEKDAETSAFKNGSEMMMEVHS